MNKTNTLISLFLFGSFCSSAIADKPKSATQTVTIQNGSSVSQLSTGVNNSDPGGTFNGQLNDASGSAIKIQSIEMYETLTNQKFTVVIDGGAPVSRNLADGDQDTGAATDNNGKFTDTPIGMDDDDMTNTASSNAKHTCTIKRFLTHQYYIINPDGTHLALKGTWVQEVDYTVTLKAGADSTVQANWTPSCAGFTSTAP